MSEPTTDPVVTVPVGSYRCAACGGVFEKGWTEEEAASELRETFPGFEPGECDLVCDDCFRTMGLADG